MICTKQLEFNLQVPYKKQDSFEAQMYLQWIHN